MSAFEDYLLSGPSKSGASAEVLELLGRKAAMAFLEKGTGLNDAVREAIKDHPELQNEHIKRVVEFANNVAFQQLFQTSEDKNVHFDVADPGVVIRDMKDGGSPAHDGKTLAGGRNDYALPPKMQMEKDQFGDPESGLEHLTRMNDQDGRMGQGEQIAKEASLQAHYSEGGLPKVSDWRHAGLDQELLAQFAPREGTPVDELLPHDHSHHANPIEDVYDLHTKLAASRTQIKDAHEQFTQLVKLAREDLYRAIKHEVMDQDGPGINGVIQVLDKVATDSGRYDLVESYVPQMMERLVEERVPTDRLRLTKTAARCHIINYRHPIVAAWGGLVKAAQEHERSTIALRDLDAGLEKTRAFLQQQAG